MKKRLLSFLLAFSFIIIVGCTQITYFPEEVEEILPEEQVEEVLQVEEELQETEPLVEEVQEKAPEIEEVEQEIEKEILTEPATEPSEDQPSLIINGKTLEERLDEVYANLHEPGSSRQIVEDFPDIELVYTDNPEDSSFYPPEILPFHYFYSKEANRTFNLCGVGRTVFICKGKLDRAISKEDLDTERCVVTPIYLGDPRLGGSGGSIDFDFGFAQ